MDESRSGAAYYKSLQRYRRMAEKAYMAEKDAPVVESSSKQSIKKGLMSFRSKTHESTIDTMASKTKETEPSDKFISDWFLLMRKMRDDKLDD